MVACAQNNTADFISRVVEILQTFTGGENTYKCMAARKQGEEGAPLVVD